MLCLVLHIYIAKYMYRGIDDNIVLGLPMCTAKLWKCHCKYHQHSMTKFECLLKEDIKKTCSYACGSNSSQRHVGSTNHSHLNTYQHYAKEK